MFNDLREFLAEAERLNEVKSVHGADWNIEIGAITELQVSRPDQPLLLFDDIKGYPQGFRVVTNFMNTSKLFALTHGLPLEARKLELVNAWRERTREGFEPVPPVEVRKGPVGENFRTGDDIDLFSFPAPLWHEHDGGRYIGTGCMVIQRDPENGLLNLGTYRVQIIDGTTAAINIIPGHHGDLIQRKYWDKGLPCPVAVVCGCDPLLWSMAAFSVPAGVSEYDYAGWFRRRPVEVIRGKTVDLPVPASAEIVLEGEIPPPGTGEVLEGPFGEWQGYYAGGSAGTQPLKITCIQHRDDPIILGAPPQIGAYDFYFGRSIMKAAALWDLLDGNMPGIKGVWQLSEARGPNMVVVSLKQMYVGHAKETAMFVAGSYPSAWAGKWVVIVDDDIDPSNTAEVLWAMGTRCDPERYIDILRDCWSSKSDPTIPPEKRERGNFTSSKAIVLACRPFYWIKQFPRTIKGSKELLERTKEKWGGVLFSNELSPRD